MYLVDSRAPLYVGRQAGPDRERGRDRPLRTGRGFYGFRIQSYFTDVTVLATLF